MGHPVLCIGLAHIGVADLIGQMASFIIDLLISDLRNALDMLTCRRLKAKHTVRTEQSNTANPMTKAKMMACSHSMSSAVAKSAKLLFSEHNFPTFLYSVIHLVVMLG